MDVILNQISNLKIEITVITKANAAKYFKTNIIGLVQHDLLKVFHIITQSVKSIGI